MSLACGLFVSPPLNQAALLPSSQTSADNEAHIQRRRSRADEKKPRRARTFSIFDPSIDVLKRMIKNATMIAPARFHDGGPTISRVGSLSREHSMTPEMFTILENVYDDLRKDDVELSRQAFTDFLIEVQGEAMVQLDKETFTLGDFVYTLAHQYRWDAVRKPSPKDYSKPITNYFINSSHNTYISGNQLASKTSPETYMNVCRPLTLLSLTFLRTAGPGGGWGGFIELLSIMMLNMLTYFT